MSIKNSLSLAWAISFEGPVVSDWLPGEIDQVTISNRSDAQTEAEASAISCGGRCHFAPSPEGNRTSSNLDLVWFGRGRRRGNYDTADPSPFLKPGQLKSEAMCSNFRMFGHVAARFSGGHVTNSIQNAYNRHLKRVLGQMRTRASTGATTIKLRLETGPFPLVRTSNSSLWQREMAEHPASM